jgi:hypothetical protein
MNCAAHLEVGQLFRAQIRPAAGQRTQYSAILPNPCFALVKKLSATGRETPKVDVLHEKDLFTAS